MNFSNRIYPRTICYFLSISLFCILFFGGFFLTHHTTQVNTLTNQKLALTNQLLIEKVTNYLIPAVKMAQTSASLFESFVLYYTLPLQLEFYTTSLVKSFPQLSAAYFGDQSGRFVMTKRALDQSLETTFVNPQSNTTLMKHYSLFGEKISELKYPYIEFDPRSRPWYQGAQLRDFWTDVYAFYSDKSLGITAAYPIYRNNQDAYGVFGIDIRLQKIETFLSELATTDQMGVFITDEHFNIVISPQNKNTQYLNDDFPLKLINRWIINQIKFNTAHLTDAPPTLSVLTNPHMTFKFNYFGDTYFATYSRFPESLGQKWCVVSIISESDLKQGYTLDVSDLIYGCIFVSLFIGIAIMVFFMRPFSKLH